MVGKTKAIISKELYDAMEQAKKDNKYINHICTVRCRLGKIKEFLVEGTDLKISLKCTQIGGMGTGTHCFIPV